MKESKKYFIGLIKMKRGKIEKYHMYYHYRDETSRGYSLIKPESYWTSTNFWECLYSGGEFHSLEDALKVYNEQAEYIKEHKFKIYKIDSKETFDNEIYRRSVTYKEVKV